jgi:hypothetical protein
MSTSFGRSTVGTATGNPVQVLSDGRTDGFKTGGVTLDWTTVTAVSGSAVTLADGTVVAIGDKYLRYGTILDKIDATGKYGPANTAAADGRQTLARGESFILNETVVESEVGSDHVPCFDAGLVFEDRLCTNENVAALDNPTRANVLTAFPAIRIHED